MINPHTIKYSIIALLCSVSGLHGYAQAIKRPLQISPSGGVATRFLNKDIYAGKPTNTSGLFGLAFIKPVSNKINIGLQAQYNSFNLSQNVTQTYQRFVTDNAIKNFTPSTAITGLFTLGFTTGSYNQTGKRSETAFTLGGGMQYFTTGGNTLQVFNPFTAAGGYTTVYKEDKGSYTNPVVQASLTQSFYIKPCIAIDITVRAQYVFEKMQTAYKPVPADSSLPLAFENLVNTKDVVATRQQKFTLSPVIGIRFIIGGCRGPKPHDDKKPVSSCFALQWTNAVAKDSCFRGDSLQFAFTQKNLIPGAVYYAIYVAPMTDLNNQKFLYNLSYPAPGFYINSSLLDANTEYAVIVKVKNVNPKEDCLQVIRSIKRCADCCKDTRLRK